MWSRQGKELSKYFPELLEAFGETNAATVIGETFGQGNGDQAGGALRLQGAAAGHAVGINGEPFPAVVPPLQGFHLTLHSGKDEFRQRPESGEVPGGHVRRPHPRT